MKPSIKIVLSLLTFASVATAQVITPVWVQRIVGPGPENTTLINVSTNNKLPILAGSRIEPNNNEDGTETQPEFVRLQRYDANRLLLFVPENGINETDPGITPAQQALAAAYPDKSIIWIDAATGASLGVAFHEAAHPALLAGINVQDPSMGNQLSAYDPVINFYWRPALDEGPPGQKALYSGINHLILRYAQLADGSGWTNVPTVAYEENVPGIGDGVTDASGGSSGDNARRWRWRNFRVYGSGTNTTIVGGGGTWRPGMHAQVLVTSDGLTFHPRGRVDDRSGGIRNDYAGGGTGSRVVKYGTDPNHPNLEVYYQGHYPAYGFNGETPERYVSDPDNLWPGSPNVTNYNQQPFVAMFEPTPGTSNTLSGATNNLPPFTWEEASRDGLPIDYNVDGVSRYDGAWSINDEANSSLDYIVSYSCPSWNNAIPVPSHGWIGIHRLDGSIAGGEGSSYELPVTERDVPTPYTANVGNEYLYNGWLEVNPDTNAPANLKKAEILGAFGPVGFGLFTVQNVPAGFTTLPPASINLLEADPLTISTVVTGSPNTYVWTKGGVPLDGTKTNLDGSLRWPATVVQGVKKANLFNPSVVVSDSGFYKLTVGNPLNGPISTADVNVTVSPDTNKPTVVSVAALATPNSSGGGAPYLVKVVFSKRIDPTTGGTPGNYSIPGASVIGVTLHSVPQAASLRGDWREAIVQTTGLTPGSSYNLTVSGVKDQTSSANVITPVPVAFKVPNLTQGGLAWDYYYLGSVSDINSLLGSLLYPNAPMTNRAFATFDTSTYTGGDLNNVAGYGALGDNYGDSLSGWIKPTVSGDYYFFLASDDASQLWLSTDSDPFNTHAIAEETGCCHGFLEPGDPTEPSVTSALQTLVAGTNYFIQAFHTEGGGGDYVKVAWRKAGDTNAAATLSPISGAYFSSYAVLPPKFNAPVYSAGQVTISWTGTGTLQESTDLISWGPVLGNPASPFMVNVSLAPHKFYRLVQ